MGFIRSTLTAVAALALVACDPSGPGDITSAPDFNTAANGEHRVVGSGHIEQASGLREFVFHALQDADGNAKGSYKVTLPNGLYFVASVTCMSVVGNTGWVAGRIVESNASSIIIGGVSYFYATDNGEGQGVPDRVSSARVNDADGQDVVFCRDRPTVLPSFDITHGNVQVQ